MDFDLNQLRELLAMFNQTQITELNLKSGDFELTLRKGDQLSSEMSGLATPPPVSFSAPVAPPTTEPPAVAPPTSNKKWVDITSPMVGTFYRSPAPDEPPFVEVGETVRRSQVVCIIEAMKLMNEIEAEANGQVMEILVQNGEPVEFGQVLMRINPN